MKELSQQLRGLKMGKRLKIVRGESPDYPALMLATIDALKALGDRATIDDINKKIVEIEELTPSELAVDKRTKDGTESFFIYHSAWARTILRHGNAIDTNNNGVWTITEVGKGITNIFETRAIHRNYRKDKGYI